MNHLYSLNVKVIAFDSEDPTVSKAAVCELSPSIEETKRSLCWRGSQEDAFRRS